MEELQKKVENLATENADIKAKIAELTEKVQQIMKCGADAKNMLGSLQGEAAAENTAKEMAADKGEELKEKGEEKVQELGNVANNALGSLFGS